MSHVFVYILIYFALKIIFAKKEVRAQEKYVKTIRQSFNLINISIIKELKMKGKLTIILLVLMLLYVGAIKADLIARYEFSDSLDSTTAADTSGYAPVADGTLNGDAVLEQTVRGQVIRFDGSGYLELSNESKFGLPSYWPDPNAPFHESQSVAFWINHSSNYPTDWLRIFNKGSYTLQMQMWGDGYLGCDITIGNDYIRGTTDIKDGQWHHIAVVYDGPNRFLSLYVDGQIEGVLLGDPNTNGWFGVTDENYRFGDGQGTTSGAGIIALMDDICIYNHPLTQEEIIELSTYHVASYPNPSYGSAVGADLSSVSWTNPQPTNSNHIISSEVFWGTDANLIEGVNGTVKILSKTIDVNTASLPTLTAYETYYWRVDSYYDLNDGGAEVKTTGHTWYFTTDNVAPDVDAGPDQVVRLSDNVTMSGSVTDDGLPNPPGATTYYWSGPDDVVIDNITDLNTGVTFPDYGTYVLTLTATDSIAEISDDIEVYIPTCEDLRNDGGTITGDISGPLGVPDCRVDFYDFSEMAKDWIYCNDPEDSNCDWDYPLP